MKKRILLLPLLIWLLLPHTSASEQVYGMSSARLRACNSQGETNVETELGSLMADAACRYTAHKSGSAQCGLWYQLTGRRDTESVLEQCLQNNSVLTVVELTPETLFQFLEQGIHT